MDLSMGALSAGATASEPAASEETSQTEGDSRKKEPPGSTADHEILKVEERKKLENDNTMVPPPAAWLAETLPPSSAVSSKSRPTSRTSGSTAEKHMRLPAGLFSPNLTLSSTHTSRSDPPGVTNMPLPHLLAAAALGLSHHPDPSSLMALGAMGDFPFPASAHSSVDLTTVATPKPVTTTTVVKAELASAASVSPAGYRGLSLESYMAAPLSRDWPPVGGPRNDPHLGFFPLHSSGGREIPSSFGPLTRPPSTSESASRRRSSSAVSDPINNNQRIMSIGSDSGMHHSLSSSSSLGGRLHRTISSDVRDHATYKMGRESGMMESFDGGGPRDLEGDSTSTGDMSSARWEAECYDEMTKRYSCDQCSASFTMLGNLRRHKKSHDPVRPFNCMHCPKGFLRKQSFVEHIRLHTGEKPFSCSMCGSCFTRRKCYQLHQKACAASGGTSTGGARSGASSQYNRDIHQHSTNQAAGGGGRGSGSSSHASAHSLSVSSVTSPGGMSSSMYPVAVEIDEDEAEEIEESHHSRRETSVRRGEHLTEMEQDTHLYEQLNRGVPYGRPPLEHGMNNPVRTSLSPPGTTLSPHSHACQPAELPSQYLPAEEDNENIPVDYHRTIGRARFPIMPRKTSHPTKLSLLSPDASATSTSIMTPVSAIDNRIPSKRPSPSLQSESSGSSRVPSTQPAQMTTPGGDEFRDPWSEPPTKRPRRPNGQSPQAMALFPSPRVSPAQPSTSSRASDINASLRGRSQGDDSLLESKPTGAVDTLHQPSSSRFDTTPVSRRRGDIGSEGSVEDRQSVCISPVPLQEVEKEKKLYHCLHCDIFFGSKMMFLLHRGLHGEGEPLRCSICRQVFASTSEFLIHH